MSENSPTPPSGSFATYVAAEKAIKEPIAAAEKAAAIERKTLTAEVQNLNDIAQMEIWGTRGRTTGLVDPATGAPLTEPIKGVVNEIRENRRYGAAANDRETAARNYEEQVQNLLDDGYELCQAKLVMDLRGEDKKFTAKMIAMYVVDGMSAAEAEGKVMGLYAKKDAKRLEIIKKEGVFTADEYEDLLKSRSWSPTRKTPDTDTGDAETTKIDAIDDTDEIDEGDDKEKPMTNEEKKHADDEHLLDSLTNEVNAARTQYARLKVARDRRILHVGKLRKEELAKAKRHLDWVSDRLMLHEKNMALEERGDRAGVSPEDFDTYAYMSAIGNAERLANALYREHLLATGKYKHEIVPAIERRASGKPIRDEEGKLIPRKYRRDKKGKSEPVYEYKLDDRGEPVLKKTVHGSFLGRLASRGMVTDAHVHLTGRDVGLPDRAFRAPHEAFDQLEQGKKSKS